MNKRLIKLGFFIILFGFRHTMLFGISTLAKNDPYPMFSSSYPYSCLLQKSLEYLKDTCFLIHEDCRSKCYQEDICVPCPDDFNSRWTNHFSLAFSGFYQKASCGRNYDREKVPLGDLEGRWHMLGMLYGPVPTTIVPGAPVFPTTLVSKRLGEAKVQIFAPLDPPPGANGIVMADRILTDSSQQVGFFSVPIKYRKHGVRFELCFQPHLDFGIYVQGGYADIKQTATSFINLTPPCPPDGCPTDCEGNLINFLPTAPQFTCSVVQQINDLLMSSSSANRIFREQGIEKTSNTQNRCDFRTSGFEDLRFSVWVRHIFELNKYNCEWPELAFIPFFNLEGSVATAGLVDRMQALAVPLGNGGHNSIAFTGGFHLDFYDTITIGFHGGATYFSSRTVNNYRLPTHETQSGVFPFATTVSLKPGNNHHFGVMMHAYRFVGKLSAHVEFVVVNHSEDTIKITDEALRNATVANPSENCPVPVFRVAQRECLTKFMSLFLNTALNYEISPNLSLGFLVQWPLQQRNAYRSTTVLGSIKGYF